MIQTLLSQIHLSVRFRHEEVACHAPILETMNETTQGKRMYDLYNIFHLI